MEKNKTVILRVDEELYERITNAGGNISETIRRLIREGLDEDERGADIQGIMDKAVDKGIREKCKRDGISTHDFYRGVNTMWEREKIFIENGSVKCRGEWKMDAFVERCRYHNEYPQKVIDKIVKALS